MVALQMIVFLNSIAVIVPPNAAKTVNTDQVIEFGSLAGVLLPPSLLTDLCRNSKSLDRMRKLKYVYFTGGPLPPATANLFSGYVQPKPAMGSTEAGAYFLEILDDQDWQYYFFPPEMGVEFIQKKNELYELIFVRKAGLERWQQVFQVYSSLERFPTKDLWTRHPFEPNRWRYAGRADDMIIFSHGEEIHASTMETEIEKYQDVDAVLIGGNGRYQPCLIIELVRETAMLSEETKLDKIWPFIFKANEHCLDAVKLSKNLVMFSSPAKRLVRTIKGTISRRESLALYSEEIEKLYELRQNDEK